ncbi:MAG: hypothetical protein ACI841_005464 [Planctomycetota bacterium]|jgi:hypothetical protein
MRISNDNPLGFGLRCPLVLACMLLMPSGAIAWTQTSALAAKQVIDERIDGIRYQRLLTREATLRRMLDELTPTTGEWGEWFLASPFPFRGHNQNALANPHAPEAEISRMRAGARGPNLEAVYTGRDGQEVRWVSLGDAANRKVDLRVHDDPSWNDNASCYLYTSIHSDVARSVELTLGSDDGIFIWLNSRLVHALDVPRGLDPESDKVSLQLEAGMNHFMAKVGQGAGGWDFQINTRLRMSDLADSKLTYFLDRDFPQSAEWDFWRKMSFVAPQDSRLEIGGIDFMPDGRPIVSTRRGDIWTIAGAYSEPPFDARFELYASGLHEALGVAVREEAGETAVYAMQRPELTRMVDETADGAADLYQTFNDDFGVSGNYHEFAFGPKFDRDGNAWISLNVGFCGSLGKSTVPYRGWALKITPDGTMIPVASGLRSPNGMGMNAEGEMFYVDNQGDWVGTNRLSHLAQDSWQGHPSSLHWREGWEASMPKPTPQPAAVWFPYPEMGQSAADVCLVDSGGRFGPFEGQVLVGDQMLATVMRVDLEEVGGVWQGACFPFLTGFDSGVNRMAFAPDGSMFVGMTDRGWGSVGRRREGLQRVVWGGETPFDVKHMKVVADGFELEFTQPLDPVIAERPELWRFSSYTYRFHAKYGSPEIDTAEHEVRGVELVGSSKVVVHLDRVRSGGYVHELAYDGLLSAAGERTLHARAYYTVQKVPPAAGR